MLVVYVSGHGFGHSVRTAVVLRDLQALRPTLPVEVVTDAPRWLFAEGVGYRRMQTDVGLVQRDGLEHDEGATLAAVGPFLAALDELSEAEASRLRGSGTRLVLGDIPALAFQVSARLGVPGVALGNFSWDEIYAPYVAQWPEFAAAIERLRAAYGQAEFLLRLPFHLPMAAFARREDVPLVARAPVRSRREVRRRLGIPPAATAVLLAFGGFDLPSLEVSSLAAQRGYFFVRPVGEPRGLVEPNVLEVAGHGMLPFPDILAACDAVVTKPGYGIVADVFACRVPVLYAERPRFVEYPLLAAALQRYGRAREVPRDDLEAGRLAPYLDRLLALDTRWADIPLNGGPAVAERLAELLG
jgi:hypothetical protein